MNGLIYNIINDLSIILADEFDRNFERKAFFDKKWVPAKSHNRKGSLLLRTAALRQSIRAIAKEHGVSFQSSLPSASLHNDGGVIKVTAKVKKFFWAMYYLAAGGLAKKKDGSLRNNKQNAVLSQEAESWKALALMKEGSEIKIPQRQFIGHHRQVDKIVKDVINTNVSDFLKKMTESLQK